MRQPSVDEIQVVFQENYEDIQHITDWMLNSEYEDIHFWKKYLIEGKVWADFSVVSLDPEVLACARRLMFKKGFRSIEMSSGYNSIEFDAWYGLFENECGVVYAIDPAKEPEVEYLLVLEPISEENWYYFYADYNEWRSQNTSAKED